MSAESMIVRFMTADYEYAAELLAFFQALEAAVRVKKGPNKEGKLHWFHAFFLSVLAGYAGGTFTPLMMGLPSLMLASDISFAACIIAFILVNVVPFGYTVSNLLPVRILTSMYAQLFRCRGLKNFVTVAFNTFKDVSPTMKYYPIPVIGPILYGSFLGNMGGFLLKGLEKHVENGIPYPFQVGLFCGSFYHFYVHDMTGFIGKTLRWVIRYSPIISMFPSLLLLNHSIDENDDTIDDVDKDAANRRTFAFFFISCFMQTMGVLQLEEFLGPTFSPFSIRLLSPFYDPSTWTVGQGTSVYSQVQQQKKDEKQAVEDWKHQQQQAKVDATSDAKKSDETENKKEK